jgi:hypothetical protein
MKVLEHRKRALSRVRRILQDGDIKSNSFGHRRAIFVVDRPFVAVSVVPDAYGVVVVGAPGFQFRLMERMASGLPLVRGLSS